jgi:hypothetical protein
LAFQLGSDDTVLVEYREQGRKKYKKLCIVLLAFLASLVDSLGEQNMGKKMHTTCTLLQ